MKKVVFVLLAGILLSGCDEGRVYEKNTDFANRLWLINDKPEFEFEITQTGVPYNLYCNVRNSVSFPYSRLFINYILFDSTGTQLQKKLMPAILFDPQTGKPEGTSGLGDIYDHRIPLLKNYTFKTAGKYKMQFEQFMRTDSLQGVLAVGLRVEKASQE